MSKCLSECRASKYEDGASRHHLFWSRWLITSEWLCKGVISPKVFVSFERVPLSSGRVFVCVESWLLVVSSLWRVGSGRKTVKTKCFLFLTSGLQQNSQCRRESPSSANPSCLNLKAIAGLHLATQTHPKLNGKVVPNKRKLVRMVVILEILICRRQARACAATVVHSFDLLCHPQITEHSLLCQKQMLASYLSLAVKVYFLLCPLKSAYSLDSSFSNDFSLNWTHCYFIERSFLVGDRLVFIKMILAPDSNCYMLILATRFFLFNASLGTGTCCYAYCIRLHQK